MQSGNQKTILLADDDLDDREVFCEFLKHREDLLILSPVENGVELIDFLEKIPDQTSFPDAIILDQNMPKRNGFQTLALLKENSRFSHIPVMVYSTYLDPVLTKKSKDMGAVMVMVKPTTPEGYNQLVDDFLNII